MAIPPDALQSVIAALQLYNYTFLISITAVVYDYFLTISDEVEYIWTKQWTWVSTLYLFVRYAGLGFIVFQSVVGSTFTVGVTQTVAMSIITGWLSVLFLGSADLVMVLRVWSMYERSRLILGILLVSFFLEMVTTIVISCMSDNARFPEVTSVQILNWSLCSWQPIDPRFEITLSAVQMTHGAILCILAIAQFARQSLEMYRATNSEKWEINRYMNLLVKQGILYFLAIFLLIVVQTYSVLSKSPMAGLPFILLYILELVPAFTLAPRFTLSIRKMYANVNGSGIDTGFGFSDRHPGDATIVFMGNDQYEGSEGVGEVPTVEGATSA